MKKSDRTKSDLGTDWGDSPIPGSGPAYLFVCEVLKAVPASRWSFAYVDEKTGGLGSLFGFPSTGYGLQGLAREFDLQRAKASSGPRIAATLGPLDGFESGITLLFADDQSDFAILTLLRTAEFGQFRSSEISALTFAVTYGSDRRSARRLQPLAETPDTVENEMLAVHEVLDGAFYVLDSDLQILLSWDPENMNRVAVSDISSPTKDRLPALLEETVRTLTASWSADNGKPSGIAKPLSFLVVRTHPLVGPAGMFIGVRIDRAPSANSLTAVAARYHITPREVQVLALLLDGNHLEEVGKRLFITSSTVQDHIKSMLEKTESRNRTELVARVLGWVMQKPAAAL